MMVAEPLQDASRRVPPVAANLGAWVVALVSAKRFRPAQRPPLWTRVRRLLLIASLALCAVAVSMIFFDALAIGHQRKLPAWAILMFEHVTDLGQSGWILIPFGTLLLVIAALSSPRIGRVNQRVLEALAARVGFVFVAVALTGSVVALVKRAVGRARPYFWEKSGPFEFDPFRWQVEYASLPSGHGTTAFATAFAIGALYPRLRIVVWPLAVLIGVSRVAVSAHYPSDVIAGALIGTFGALVVRNWFATRRLGFVVGPDRAVRALPGPSLRRLKQVMGRVLSA